MRYKNRYLLIEVLHEVSHTKLETPPKAVRPGDIYNSLIDSIEAHFGDYGVGSCQQTINVRGISRDTGFSSIRCPREHERMIRTALTFITEIRGKRALVSVKHVGGSMRSFKAAVEKMDPILAAKLGPE